MGQLTNAFFKWQTAGGAGAKLTVTYAESLFDADGEKGHRDSIAGKHIRGVYDEYLTAGDERTYTTLWFRTARYLQVSYETADEPLRLRGLEVEEIAYPFREVGSFTSPDGERRIGDILDVGWRTARLCAQETYVDCPYYEQLQYVGDTRIQALISLYVSGGCKVNAQGHRTLRRQPHGRGADHEPLPRPHRPGHPALLPDVGDDGLRLPDAHRRCGLCARSGSTECAPYSTGTGGMS